MEKRDIKKSRISSVLQEGFGKMPPQAIDMEEAVLGAILLEKDSISQVRGILNEDCFYKNAHQLIYKAAIDLYSRHEPIDILTVSYHLRTSGDMDLVGGPAVISELTNRIGSAANLEFHARIVFEKYVQREVIRTFSQGTANAFVNDADALNGLNEAQETIDALYKMIHGSGTKTWTQQLSDTYDQINKAAASDNHLFGIPTGFKELDKITSGRIPGDLVIIAARPSMGKSSRMLQEIYNLATAGVPVGVFSLEMPFHQLIIKLNANQMQYNSNLIRSGRMDYERKSQLSDAMESLRKMPIVLNDRSALNILEIKSIARMWVQKFGIKALYVDYLQIIHGPQKNEMRRNREQEISQISSGLKSIAKDMDIPVIALAQLSRAVEGRPDKRPILSDLRESGSIEQDADLVEFLFRPEYYGIETDENNNSLRGIMECTIAKNRNGALGKSLLRFQKEFSRLEDIVIEPKPFTPPPIDEYNQSTRRMAPNRAVEETEDEPF